MGSKMNALAAELQRIKASDPMLGAAVRPMQRIREMLARPWAFPDADQDDLEARVLPTNTRDLAIEIIRLEQIKSLVNKLSDATSEAHGEAEKAMLDMLTESGTRLTEPEGLGRRFRIDPKHSVKAIEELGGTSNPDLKQWLIDNAMPDVAKGSIHAGTLASNVNQWREDHPIEKIVTESDGSGRILEGQELLRELGLEDAVNEEGQIVTAQQQYDVRAAQHARLLKLVTIKDFSRLSVTAVK